MKASGFAPPAGTFQVSLEVRDARGAITSGIVTVEVAPFRMEMSRLAEAVLGGTDLTDGEAAYLDGNGNVNGNLDVGDARAWRFPPGGQR